jgi:hypothetical protein
MSFFLLLAKSSGRLPPGQPASRFSFARHVIWRSPGRQLAVLVYLAKKKVRMKGSNP